MKQPTSIFSDNGIWFVWYISNIRLSIGAKYLIETRLGGFKIGKSDILSGVSRHTLIPLKGS